jgi:hypothetical protein
MEELHRLHKEVPFGWVAMLQDYLAARASRAVEREARNWNRGTAANLQAPSDLHSLAGPH